MERVETLPRAEASVGDRARAEFYGKADLVLSPRDAAGYVLLPLLRAGTSPA